MSKAKTKADRRKARKNKKAARARRSYERRRYRDRFPDFVFEENKADQAFVDAVKPLIKGLDFRDKSLFQPEETLFLELMKAEGYQEAVATVLRRTHERHRYPTEVALAFLLGYKIFELLRRAGQYERWIPYHDIEVLPNLRRFVVRFSSLLSARTPGGRRYFPSHKPKVTVRGKDYTACFSRHAIERLCERAVGDWRDYAGAGDAYALIAKTKWFEPTHVDYRGRIQYAFAVYQACFKGFVSGWYTEEVLGVETENDRFLYLAGYCPIAIFDSLAGATTMLSPGMRGTPEAKLLTASDLPRAEKERIRKSGETAASFSKLVETRDFSAIKWFHDNGIPQVIEVNETRFKY